MIILEDKRSQLLSRARQAEKEKGDGKTRYEKRVKSKFSSSVKEYNQINMNQLFKDNILTVNIPVVGETDNYIVSISFGGLLDIIRERIERNNSPLDLRTIIQSLIQCFNSDNVFIHCSCLHPDTKIKLLDGTCPSISDMKQRFDSGEKMYVFSTDKNGDFIPGEVEKVWITKIAREFAKVTLDNGKEILTTPDHLYRMRDGSYKQAIELKDGDSLMPLYFSQTKNGYDTIKLNSTGKYHSVYKLVAEYLKSLDIQSAINRATLDDKMRYKVAIHHGDFNKHNNNPDNLHIMTAREHWDYHANLCGDNRPITNNMRDVARQNAYKRNANPTPAMLEARKKFNESGKMRNYDADRKEQQSEIMKTVMADYYKNLNAEERKALSDRISEQSKKSWQEGKFNTEKFNNAAKQRGIDMHTAEREILSKQGIQRYWKNISNEEREQRNLINMQNLQKAQDRVKGVPKSEEWKKKMRNIRLSETPEQEHSHNLKIAHSKIKKVLMFLIENKLELTEENYLKYRKNSPNVLKYFDSINSAVSFFELNHKVKSVQIIQMDGIPVYDIKIKNSNNFLVDAGVILHNCDDWKYRMAYWATINDINSGEPQMSNGKWIRNPKDKLGPGCKHVMLCLANTGWLIKVASVINNYIKYMSMHYQKAYSTIIYPAIYGKEYEGDVQLDITGDELDTGKETIDTANIEGGKSGQFKAGNKYRYQKQEKPDDAQISIEDEEIDET